MVKKEKAKKQFDKKQNVLTIYIYMEGGGDKAALHKILRDGMKSFLEKANFQNNMPSIVACGGREQAFDRFCTAIHQGKHAFLLVDSESPVTCESPWEHLKNRQGDKWEKPDNVTDNECHLMVQCMESWFLADIDTLADFYGKGFNRKVLATTNIEIIDKQTVFKQLEKATQNTLKGKYNKGNHSFYLLGMIDPQKVRKSSDWANRFINILTEQLKNKE